MAWTDIVEVAQRVDIAQFFGADVQVVDTETGEVSTQTLIRLEHLDGRDSLVIGSEDSCRERYLSYSPRTGKPLTKYQVKVNA